MNPLQSSPKFFLYARKSSENEDQQVASIGSQIKELKTIADREGVQIVDVLSEAQSAKAPGRPVFNHMVSRLAKGEANGILCWKLDRLARNPIDGGNISWMLQQSIIQRIQTHERSYSPADNVLMMSVEFGMANQYVRDLSQNVKRGLLSKVQQGWYPGVAKPGYQNDPLGTKGERIIQCDSLRFPLLQRAFQLVLTGMYTPSKALQKLNDEWGYRTMKRRKIGGVPISQSTFYRILSDPFYYGVFEFPKESGNWYRGKHTPMITEEEFWRIQKILGKKIRPRPKEHTFAYTGLIQCGQCSAAITAEVKDQVICTACKRKFSSRHRTNCPKCATAIEAMSNPIHRRYIYYHCTRRKKTPCNQGVVEEKSLETQVSDFLQTITISESIKRWCIQRLEKEALQELGNNSSVRTALQKAHSDTQKRLSNLLKLKISPQNNTGDLLSDEEFAEQKSSLTRELRRIEQKLTTIEKTADQWSETAKKTFTFACYALQHFEKGSIETKRAIVYALGSNLTLQDKKLRISWHKHLILMQDIHTVSWPQKGRFEPNNFLLHNEKSRASNPAYSKWLPGWDDVRTLFHTLYEEGVDIPNLTAR